MSPGGSGSLQHVDALHGPELLLTQRRRPGRLHRAGAPLARALSRALRRLRLRGLLLHGLLLGRGGLQPGPAGPIVKGHRHGRQGRRREGGRLQRRARPEAHGRGILRRGGGHRGAKAERRAEHRPGVGVRPGEQEAKLLQLGAVLRLGSGVDPRREEDDAVPLALKVVHRMRAVPVEHAEAVAQLHLDLAVLRHVLQLGRLVVLRPVGQLPAREVAEGLNHGGAEVVLVPVQRRRVVAVQVERGPAKLAHLGRQALPQPLHDDPRDRRVHEGRGRDVDVADAVDEKAQGIAKDPALALPHDVGPVAVAREGPLMKRLLHLLVCDPAALRRGRGQALAGLALRHQAVRAHERGLARALADREVLVAQAQVLGELAAVPPVDDQVHLRERALVRDLGHVDGLLADRSVHPDEAAFPVPAPIGREAAELQCFAHRARLGVVLVADVALRARRLGVRPVGDPRLLAPAGHHDVGLVPVAGVASAGNDDLHVLRLGPILRHADLQCLPLLRGHRRGGLGLLPALRGPGLLLLLLGGRLGARHGLLGLRHGCGRVRAGGSPFAR
mmetsp:Transcript_79925/g.247993  ORF Transcript_79925/g.247993 Transcript_79925/m.247993 type:complete len:559 (+) Transcript_79925:202-1878(+)